MKRFFCFCLALMILIPVFAPLNSLLAVEQDKYPWRDQLFGRELAELELDGYAYYAYAREIIGMVNELRISLGLHPLVYNAQLEVAAMQRAAETSVLWSHMRPDGTFIFYTPPYSSENIAAGNISPKATFQQWVDSPPHYAAMVNPNFISIGIGAFGTAKGEPPQWWAQVFSNQVGGTDFTQVEDREPYQPRVRLAPGILRLVPKAVEVDSIAWEQTFSDGNFSYRTALGREICLYPFVHYDVADEYQVPTLLQAEEWEWNNRSPEVLDLIAPGKILALDLGEGRIEVSLKENPEIKYEYIFSVSPTLAYALEAEYKPELVKAAEAKLLADSEKYYQELAAQEEADQEADREPEDVAEEETSEVTGETELTGEIEAEVKDRQVKKYPADVAWDSRLERYALEIAKHASLGESSRPVEDYPDLQASDGILDLGANYWWIYFSNSDSAQDQLMVLPTWAKSYGIAVIESGQSVYTAGVFSDVPADSRHLYEEAVDLRYRVGVFADRAKYEIRAQDQTINDRNLADFKLAKEDLLALNKAGQAPTIVGDPLDKQGDLGGFNLDQGLAESGQDLYLLRLTLAAQDLAVAPRSTLDQAFLRFKSLNPEIMELSPEGVFELKANGSVAVEVEIFNPDTFDPVGPNQAMAQHKLNFEVDLDQFKQDTQSEQSAKDQNERAKSGLNIYIGIGILLIVAGLAAAYIYNRNKEKQGDA